MDDATEKSTKTRKARSTVNLYHLSPAENLNSISVAGLRANAEGDIYLFTHLVVADTIARNQVFCREYVVFRVSPRGLRSPLLPDDVAELSARFQRVVRQPKIAPSYLRLVGVFPAETERLTEWDYLLGEWGGHSRAWTDEIYAVQKSLLSKQVQTGAVTRTAFGGPAGVRAVPSMASGEALA